MALIGASKHEKMMDQIRKHLGQAQALAEQGEQTNGVYSKSFWKKVNEAILVAWVKIQKS